MITSLYVFGDNDTLAHGEKQTSRVQRFLNMTIATKISEKCKPIMIDLFCRYHFPPCDTSLDKPHARRICRKTCEYMDQDLCKEEMVHVRQAAAAAPVVDKDMINCALYGTANGGDAPECYQYYSLPGACISANDVWVTNIWRSIYLRYYGRVWECTVPQWMDLAYLLLVPQGMALIRDRAHRAIRKGRLLEGGC